MGSKMRQFEPKFGATGKRPRGRIHLSDEGELRFGVLLDTEHGVIVLNFGKPVAWMGLPPALARQLASLLIQKADELEAIGPLPAPPS